jgi:hypothetical protein
MRFRECAISFSKAPNAKVCAMVLASLREREKEYILP